jgi:hypothetical protein
MQSNWSSKPVAPPEVTPKALSVPPTSPEVPVLRPTAVSRRPTAAAILSRSAAALAGGGTKRSATGAQSCAVRVASLRRRQPWPWQTVKASRLAPATPRSAII